MARYFRRLFPSLSSSIEGGSVRSYSIKPCPSSSHAMRVAFSVLGFSSSGGALAMICRARLAASTTYANWLSGAFVCTVISVFSSERCQKFIHSRAAPRARAAERRHDRLRFASRAFHVVAQHAIIVILAERRNFIPRLRQTPRKLFARI